MKPLGKSHSLLRRLRSLRRDRASRDREGVFVAEGIHLAFEALRAGASIECAVAADRIEGTPEGAAVLEALRSAGIVVHVAGNAAFDATQDARAPQPVALLVRRTEVRLERALDAAGSLPLLVGAFGLQDPGNLGSLVRTADAAGAGALAAVGSGTDPYHPRAVRATMGSIFRLPIARTEADAWFDALERRRIVAVGAYPSGGIDYARFDWSRPVAILLGSEGRGLRDAFGARAHERVTIPLRPGVESLSVGAAGAVLLFAAARGRLTPEVRGG